MGVYVDVGRLCRFACLKNQHSKLSTFYFFFIQIKNIGFKKGKYANSLNLICILTRTFLWFIQNKPILLQSRTPKVINLFLLWHKAIVIEHLQKPIGWPIFFFTTNSIEFIFQAESELKKVNINDEALQQGKTFSNRI